MGQTQNNQVQLARSLSLSLSLSLEYTTNLCSSS